MRFILTRSAAWLPVLFVLFGCGGGLQPWKAPTERDKRDDPARVRPGYCSAGLPFWWPLSPPEAAALRALDQARAGDWRALSALAVLASGDRRDAPAYRMIQDHIERFVTETRPRVETAKDDWHRGYELHRAMHRVFFKSEGPGLDRYELHQSRFTGLFQTGRYNCISSAMLFTVLARAFDMPVRGVSVPTHAFAELALASDKTLEVETTSNTGFDHVHDERFYREAAAEWSSSRGLAPVTFEQYQRRQILEPYRLMALGMLNQTIYEKGEAQARLAEAAAFVDPASVEAQRMRVQLYITEANDLYEQGAARTTIKMFECLGPTLVEAESQLSADANSLRLLAWTRWYYADALAVAGRGDEAVAIARGALGAIDVRWEDAASLRENFVSVLMNRMLEHMDKQRYELAVATMDGQGHWCKTSRVCTDNFEGVFLNWSLHHQNTGNWHGARDALRACLSPLPQSTRCRDALTDLESRHRF
jgi:tetratricopeptide (TPR) repeat protein